MRRISIAGLEGSNPRPPLWEWVAILSLVLALFGFDLLTYNLYPAVWCDEVLFSEPAVNLLRHGSYTTFAYQFQPMGTFPIVNCPLYGMSLVPWLSMFGTSVLAIRSWNFFLIGLAAFLCWNLAWRYGWVRSAWGRLWVPVLVHLGYGMSFAFRCSRPDMLGFVSLLFLALAFGMPRSWVRGFWLLFWSAVTVWIGLQVALFACFAAGVAWLTTWCWTGAGVEGRTSNMAGTSAFGKSLRETLTLKDLTLVSLGMGLGFATMLCFFAGKGMLGYFVPPLFGLMKGQYFVQSEAQPAWTKLVRLPGRAVAAYTQDFSGIVLAAGTALLTVGGWRTLRGVTRRLTIHAFLMMFGTPVLFEVVGHFAFYYAYLQFVPMTFAVLAIGSDLAEAGREPGSGFQWWRPVTAVACGVALMVGLPMRLGLTFASSRLPPRAEIAKAVQAAIHPEDQVFSDYLPFFEVKQIAKVVYCLYSSETLCRTGVHGSELSDGQRQAVTVLLAREEEKDRLSAFFGGEWVAVTEPFGESQDFSRLSSLKWVGARLGRYATQPQTERYPVRVYRRASPAGTGAGG